ncbi:MAG: phosphatidylserine decarboxylase family protein [Planctomycetes bacterium]|nr:phosphatidylserine decarboxylase family protein [Planctomycetota bacterium]
MEDFFRALSTDNSGGTRIDNNGHKTAGVFRQGWSKLRRFWLVTARRGYVRRHLALREGQCNRCGLCCRILFRCPYFDGTGCKIHGNHFSQCKAFPIDKRDIDLIRQMGGECGFSFKEAPMKTAPFTRYGLRPVLAASGLSAAAAAGAAFLVGWWALLFLLPAAFVLYFFRDPERHSDDDSPNVVLAPADGTIVGIREVEMPLGGGKAVMIDIFLSILNVHMNRAPVAGTVAETKYQKGKFLNALRGVAGEVNENNLVVIESPSGVRFALKQIAGVIARRIVCSVAPGDTIAAGERVGMIKFGSRTQVFIPADTGFEVCAEVGGHVRAGKTVLGHLG